MATSTAALAMFGRRRNHRRMVVLISKILMTLRSKAVARLRKALATLVFVQSRRVASERERGSNLLAALFLVKSSARLRVTDMQVRGEA
jgi:hypothetical protein